MRRFKKARALRQNHFEHLHSSHSCHNARHVHRGAVLYNANARLFLSLLMVFIFSYTTEEYYPL